MKWVHDLRAIFSQPPYRTGAGALFDTEAEARVAFHEACRLQHAPDYANGPADFELVMYDARGQYAASLLLNVKGYAELTARPPYREASFTELAIAAHRRGTH